MAGQHAEPGEVDPAAGQQRPLLQHPTARQQRRQRTVHHLTDDDRCVTSDGERAPGHRNSRGQTPQRVVHARPRPGDVPGRLALSGRQSGEVPAPDIADRPRQAGPGLLQPAADLQPPDRQPGRSSNGGQHQQEDDASPGRRCGTGSTTVRHSASTVATVVQWCGTALQMADAGVDVGGEQAGQ